MLQEIVEEEEEEELLERARTCLERVWNVSGMCWNVSQHPLDLSMLCDAVLGARVQLL